MRITEDEIHNLGIIRDQQNTKISPLFPVYSKIMPTVYIEFAIARANPRTMFAKLNLIRSINVYYVIVTREIGVHKNIIIKFFYVLFYIILRKSA